MFYQHYLAYAVLVNQKTLSYQFTRILVLNMVYQKNFYFTVATVINILNHSILVKQQIQNFHVLMKLISGLFLLLLLLNICSMEQANNMMKESANRLRDIISKENPENINIDEKGNVIVKVSVTVDGT